MFLKLLLLFVTVPLVEFFLLVRIGSKIGFLPTILIIVVTGFIGAWLTRVQGRHALNRFREATAGGRLPHREVVDGIMILVAGAVLLTPGFLTDVAGFLLLVPGVRSRVGVFLMNYFKRRVRLRASNIHVSVGGVTAGSGYADRPDSIGEPRQVKARVIEEDEEER